MELFGPRFGKMGTTRGRRHEAERAEGYERAPELLAGNWYQQKPDQKTEGYRKPESPVSDNGCPRCFQLGAVMRLRAIC